MILLTIAIAGFAAYPVSGAYALSLAAELLCEVTAFYLAFAYRYYRAEKAWDDTARLAFQLLAAGVAILVIAAACHQSQDQRPPAKPAKTVGGFGALRIGDRQ
jgi:4-amino-4-deoxy-L-arabinose transferase-like glycosyltransferase